MFKPRHHKEVVFSEIMEHTENQSLLRSFNTSIYKLRYFQKQGLPEFF